MSLWDERIRDHKVWATMQLLGPAVDRAYKVKGISESLPSLERLKAVLAYCGKRLAAADPLITAIGPLDDMARSFITMQNELDALVVDQVPAHIETANVIADGALIAANQIPGLYSPEELGLLVSSSVAYRDALEKSLADAKAIFEKQLLDANVAVEQNAKETKAADEVSKTTAKALEARLGDLSASLDAEKLRLSQITTDYQGQFSAAQAARNTEFADALRLGQQELTKLVADYQKQFSTGQDTRSQTFTEAQTARQANYEKALAEYNTKLLAQDADFAVQKAAMVKSNEATLELLRDTFKAEATEILGKITASEKEVEKLVGVIGNLGVTSGYLRAANKAQYGMWVWQVLTVISLCTLTVLAYMTMPLLEDASGKFNWGGFAGRVLLLASLGVIAAYSGFQADKLFTDEKRNRKLALELEAIGPYLAPLPIEDQNKFRVAIGDRSFGRDLDTSVPSHHKSPTAIFDVLLKTKQGKQLVELLSTLLKETKE